MKKGIWIFVAIVAIILLIILSFSFVGQDNGIETDDVVDGNMRITSSVFSEGEQIPSKYTCDGNDINPPLSIADVPENAQSLVLIMDDPDAPAGTWVHWVVFNIDPSTSTIGENSVPSGSAQGGNSWGNNNYQGPCPPSGTHRYFFKLYALDKIIEFDVDPLGSIYVDKEAIEDAMEGHILEKSELMGRYTRG